MIIFPSLNTMSPSPVHPFRNYFWTYTVFIFGGQKILFFWLEESFINKKKSSLHTKRISTKTWFSRLSSQSSLCPTDTVYCLTDELQPWGCNLQSSTNDSLWFGFLLEIQLALISLKDLQSDDWYNLHSENRWDKIIILTLTFG